MMLVQVLAKQRKAAGLALPRSPEDAVRMLRGCHDNLLSPLVDSEADESCTQLYGDLELSSADEWSEHEHSTPSLVNTDPRAASAATESISTTVVNAGEPLMNG